MNFVCDQLSVLVHFGGNEEPMKRNKMFLNYLDNTEKRAVPRKSTEQIVILEDSIRERRKNAYPSNHVIPFVITTGLFTDWASEVLILDVNLTPTAFTQEEFYCYRQIKNLRDCLDVASYWPSTRGICQPTRTMSAFSDVGFTVMDICYLVVWNW